MLGRPSVIVSGGLDVSPSALRFDLPVMIAVAIACLPVFFTGHRIDRWEGALFLLYYVAYVGWLLLASARPAGDLGPAALGFTLPLLAITLGIVLWRWLRRDSRALPPAA